MGDWSSDVCPSDLAQRLGGYGNYVEVEHGNAIQTRYGHMSSYIVRSGQQVKRGDILGYVGSTGRSTGNHLHYEVRIEGAPVNPLRSEEHTSDLQSLMRISYAVFCLKKKKSTKYKTQCIFNRNNNKERSPK